MWSSLKAFEKQRETGSPVQRLLQERLLYLFVQIIHVDGMADRSNVSHDSYTSLERTRSDALCSSVVSGTEDPTAIFGLCLFNLKQGQRWKAFPKSHKTGLSTRILSCYQGKA